MTPEGKVQAYAMRKFKAIGGLVRKLKYEGRTGAPDLLIILPSNVVVFIEVKATEDILPMPHQVDEHARIARRGANIHVVGSPRQVDILIAKYAVLV